MSVGNCMSELCVCGGKRVYDLCINECLWVNCVCVWGGGGMYVCP